MDIGNLVSAFFTSPGPGGVIILVVLVGALFIYIGLTRWILRGGKEQK